ncbi:hypothetical protein SCLCIDRAFT_1213195 [Scleroderma citrinum Foug A]|uniref:Uncharacterized protein n=1 Tax=Scleroderma citrinum Foug A TaxID=1036808 RepID=A0A0C3AIG1_9AGAM|nr:hypothetical protein SCLCIDRAFT_1213195 [Scleroderma citrinum Foug A]
MRYTSRSWNPSFCHHYTGPQAQGPQNDGHVKSLFIKTCHSKDRLVCLMRLRMHKRLCAP